MKLYSLNGTTGVSHGDETFEVSEDGSFEFPDELGATLLNTHLDGKAVWETETGRVERLMAEEAERRKDPATLLAAVEALAARVNTEDEPKKSEPKKAAPAKK